MSEFKTAFFESFAGTQLAIHEMGAGSGRPLILLHGLFSNAHMNWIKFGTAERLVEAGWRLIMPDFRGHGESEAPQSADAYPEDVLARDVLALIDHLELKDYDLGGYSLGARQAVRAVIGGARPARMFAAGMGLKGMTDAASGSDWFIDIIERRGEHKPGSEAYYSIQFMKTTGADPEAAIHVLRSQANARAEALAAFPASANVICGRDDVYFEECGRLAETLPGARLFEIPGNHMSCISKPELAAAITEALQP